MNLKHLSNSQLNEQTLVAVEKKRLSTIEVLWHLRENERRMLYAEMGFKDLKEYCVIVLKISEGSAWRRINGMRLLQEVPEVEAQIQSGDLNLTQIVKARSHFREVKASPAEKREVLLSLINQSTRATERILAEKKPEGSSVNSEVIERPLRGQRLEATIVLDELFQKELEEIQILLGKPYSKLELFQMLVKEKLGALKKDLNKQRPEKLRLNKRVAQPALAYSRQKQIIDNSKSNLKIKKSRYTSQYTLRALANRDQHQCQFIDPVSGRQCSARFHLQIEHIQPFAKGGANNIENLQLLCINHNKFRALQQFGTSKMRKYILSLR